MLALKSHLTTAFQTASTQHMPTCVTDLIADYAATDYSIALEEYDLSADYVISNSARNRKINEMISLAITSPDCDTKIKSKIISVLKSIDISPRGSELLKVIRRIQSLGLQINMDNVDFSGLNLYDLDLSNMTARGASFIHTFLVSCNLTGADLTGAVLHKSNLICSNLTGAILRNTLWGRTLIDVSNLTRVDLSGTIFRSVIFAEIELQSVTTDDQHLLAAIDAHKVRSYFFSSSRVRGIYSSGRGFTAKNFAALNSALHAIKANHEDIHSDHSCAPCPD